jgi:hypothetical protein
MTRRGVMGDGANHGLASWVAPALLLGLGACTSDEVNVTPVVTGELAEPEVAAENEAPSAPSEAEARSRWGRLPMRFEENRGQHDARARYVARQRGLTLFATESALVLSLRVPGDDVPEVRAEHVGATHVGGGLAGLDDADAGPMPRPPHEAAEAPVHHVGLRMWLAGGAERAAIEPTERLETRSNYLIGNDASAWRTDIPNWGALRYRDVRPGVDLVLRGSEDGRVEYDLVVAPGASSELVMRIEGAERLSVADDGALEVHVAGVVLRQSAPVAFQEVDGRRVAVEVRYQVLGRERVGLEVGAYDRDRVLVIDPVLEYSTYLGAVNNDYGYGIAVDGAGAAYLVGYTTSMTFPATMGAAQAVNAGGADVYVAKLNATGAALDYATYLGGASSDVGDDIAVDAAGAVYVTGYTLSTNFPATSGAAQTANAGSNDAFVAKLNAMGSGLVYATYLGGANNDYGYDIAVDEAGAAHVTGQTYSTNFPTTMGAVQPANRGESDLFVAKVNAMGTGLAYATCLGGGKLRRRLRHLRGRCGRYVRDRVHVLDRLPDHLRGDANRARGEQRCVRGEAERDVLGAHLRDLPRGCERRLRHRHRVGRHGGGVRYRAHNFAELPCYFGCVSDYQSGERRRLRGEAEPSWFRARLRDLPRGGARRPRPLHRRVRGRGARGGTHHLDELPDHIGGNAGCQCGELRRICREAERVGIGARLCDLPWGHERRLRTGYRVGRGGSGVRDGVHTIGELPVHRGRGADLERRGS